MVNQPIALHAFYYDLLYTDRYLRTNTMTKQLKMTTDQMKQQQVLIQMTIRAWDGEVAKADQYIFDLPDEKWYSEVSPGRNRAIYLIGHLTASNDSLFEILGVGQRLYPELEAAFIRNPDRSGLDMPDPGIIKTHWFKVHEGLRYSFLTISDEEWFGRHMAMTDEDFAMEPMRNKLNVLMSRTRHLAYHLGQLKLIQ